MLILGLSCYYHDSAIAVVEDGRIEFAAQEERFSRIKNDSAFPAYALKAYLTRTRRVLSDFDAIVFYETPAKKRRRQLWSLCAAAPFGYRAFRRYLSDIADWEFNIQDRLIEDLALFASRDDIRTRLKFVDHHDSHAASAFFPSPFDEALIVTIDGVGEWETTTISRGGPDGIKRLDSVAFPHSLGLMYSAFTSYLGFKINNGEYKMMGLAPFGEPKFRDQILGTLVDLTDDGFFRLNMKYFGYLKEDRMFNDRFIDLFGQKPKKPEAEFAPFHMDIACSVQSALETAVEHVFRSAVSKHGLDTVCYAGGVALNCVANGKLLDKGIVRRLWIQPAAGDAGGALGAALLGSLAEGDRRPETRSVDAMGSARLGPDYSRTAIKRTVKSFELKAIELTENDLMRKLAKLIAQGAIVGWFQGRAEFGPRALGGRSILADPRSNSMQSKLNRLIKQRESFRPFAPIVLREEAKNWFKNGFDSPYMLLVDEMREDRRIVEHEYSVKTNSAISRVQRPRSSVPAITHVDYSARIQTVSEESDPRLYGLLKAFHELTEIPMLINTSFNVNEEPIVCSPTDAIRCFLATGLDCLVIDRFVIERSAQSAEVLGKYRRGEPSPKAEEPHALSGDIYSLN